MTERELMNECEMLKGDIDRMMITQDPTELNDLYEWASNRLRTIYHENMEMLPHTTVR